MRIIDINIAGGFPSLVIESKKEFATKYGLQAEYWTYFDPDEHPDVLSYLKTNLTDLANHYHALYQSPELKEQKSANFDEARHWYREFLVSFPMDDESPTINYHLADLLLENRLYDQAAVEYEKTAYDYPDHEKSSTAGYAAVFAYREHLDTDAAADKDPIKREVVRSSLRFAETFPGHEKAAVVLGAAVDDLYDMQDYEQAVLIAHQLVESFPEADVEVRRSVWIVIGHASYELHLYAEAEAAYLTVLEMLPPEDQRHDGLVDNLAASIYQQGAEANSSEDYRAAANHFLRISSMAPTSAIRPTAEFDAAASLIQLQDWAAAASVLTGFRATFPNHELQPEVTKKIAYVYREDGRLAQAAGEYERIETESDDEEVRREALQTAAELYDNAGDSVRTLEVYQRYVAYFPRPVELNLETRNKISLLLKASNDQQNYLSQLKQIVAIDAAAGDSRTARTRYLASKAALVLAEQSYDQFADVRLVKPFDVNLRRKQALMKGATQQFNRLLDYEVGEVTAAATFYLAEIYAHFSKALMESERPDNLAPLELEQYELAIEEQAYPFEEKAIAVHESNLELISLDIYNRWVDRSLQRLAEFMPARYDRPEAEGQVIVSLETYSYEIDNPEPSVDPLTEEQAQTAVAVTVKQPVSAAPEPDMTTLAVEPEQSEPAELQGEVQSADGQVAHDDGDKELPGKTTTQKE
jgi:TolA-binding protein